MDDQDTGPGPPPTALAAEGGPPGHARGAVVVGVDRRPESAAALRAAARLAADLGAAVHAVHAVDLADFPDDPDAPDWEAEAGTHLQEAGAAVRAAMADAPVPWTYRVVRADPARALLLVADEVDARFIAVGSRGEGARTVLERLLSPSVSHRLVNKSPRPVLVVGQGARRDRA
jgi:nucleotide-binding universal stress UspA family protein